MISTQYINLNMVPSGVMPVLHCSQYDVGRPLGVVIYNGSESVDLSGYTVTIEGTRTDRTPVTAGVTTDGNIGVFTTTPTMTNENDTYRAKVVLTDNAGRVSSLAFVMCVDEKTMDENAEEIEEDASLYQQYTGTVQTIIAQIRGDLAAEITARQNAVSAEATARQTAVSAEASARQAADNTLQSNINAEASARATEDASLQSQINQLIAPSGSAPSAAEVENARIGSDGTVYPTLGDAIRTQNSLLKSQLNASISPTWSSGYINPGGTVGASDSYRYTDYIPLVVNGIERPIAYTTWLFNNDAIGLYDAEKVFVGSIPGTTGSNQKYTGVITPSQAKYIRVSTYVSHLADTKIEYTDFAHEGIADGAITNSKLAQSAVDNGNIAFNRRNPDTNLINGYTPGYIQASTGKVVPSSQLYHTDYIPLVPGKTYYTSKVQSTYNAYYDSNYQFVSGFVWDSGNITFTVPSSGVAFGRFSFYDLTAAQQAYIFTRGNIPEPYREELYSDEFDIVADKTVGVKKLSYLEHDPHTNFVDVDKVVTGRYINARGELNVGAGYKCSDFVPVEEGKTYYVYNIVLQYCAFYDENYQYVSSFTGSGTSYFGTFTVPTGAKYVRVSSMAESFGVSLESGIPKQYGLCQTKIRDATSDVIPTDFMGRDICAFHKILCIGDSLTAGGFNNDQSISLVSTKGAMYCWPTQLGKMTGCEITNKSTSGISTPQWYSTYGADDLSGHDCAIIQLGVNDGQYGGFTEEVQTAYSNIFNKLKTENKGIKIFVSTIIHALSYGSVRTYSDALIAYIESLNDSNIIVLDMNAYDHLAESNGYNAGHLSAYGYWRLAQDYISYISWYMYNHKDEFRFLQFIGTDCTYNGGGAVTGEI